MPKISLDQCGVTAEETLRLKVGLVVIKEAVVDGLSGAVVIPPRALVGEYVYVVSGGKLELRKVVKGYGSMNQVEILTGLKEGEVVVVEQQDRYHEGERVRTQVLTN